MRVTITIPPAVQRAIESGACVELPDRDGFTAFTEPTPCPSCGAMRAFFIVRQSGPTLEWSCCCSLCAA